MNDLGHGQLSNPNRSFKLVLMHLGNHRELLLRYFHYLGQSFNCISLLESISSNTEGGRSYLDHTIIFVDFMLYLIYDVLDISWVENRKL